MRYKVVDPLLKPLPDPKRRVLELELLAEYEKAGKIKRIDAKLVDRRDVAFVGSELLEELGTDDGNFRVMKIDEVEAKAK